MGITINGVKVAGAGTPGKSAYQVAVDGGYTGTEEEFNQALLDIPEHLNKENPHNVTAAQAGAVAQDSGNTVAFSVGYDAGGLYVVTEEE